MKTLSYTSLAVALFAASAAFVSACNEDEPGMADDDGNVDPEECDPEGVDPEMGALLNAPVAADVEVIQKVPQHPGAAGPLDLP